jgi:hypothetical protein
MDIVAHIAPIMIGLFAGYFLSSRVGVWAVSLLFSLRGTDAPAGRATRIKRIALLTLLHSGPWLVAVAALVAFYIRSKRGRFGPSEAHSSESSATCLRCGPLCESCVEGKERMPLSPVARAAG